MGRKESNQTNKIIQDDSKKSVTTQGHNILYSCTVVLAIVGLSVLMTQNKKPVGLECHKFNQPIDHSKIALICANTQSMTVG